MGDDPRKTTGSDAHVVGVLLAAGESTRFDEGPKLLAELDGEALVRHAAETLDRSDVDEIVVVTGHAEDAVKDALAGIEVVFRHNSNYERGQVTSVATGASAGIDRRADALVFALGDMPVVDPTTVDALIDAWRDAGHANSDPSADRAVEPADDTAHSTDQGEPGTWTAPGIFVPTFDDRRGNPVCFDERHLAELSRLRVDTDHSSRPTDADPIPGTGGRILMERHDVRRVPVEDPGIHRDVDTPADLEVARHAWL